MLDGIIAGHKPFMTAPADGEALTAELAKSSNKDVVDKAKELATHWGAKANVAVALKTSPTARTPSTTASGPAQLLRGNKGRRRPQGPPRRLRRVGQRLPQDRSPRALPEVGSDTDSAAVLKIWANPTPPDTRRSPPKPSPAAPPGRAALLTAVKDKKI